jgi:hypothetical protein
MRNLAFSLIIMLCSTNSFAQIAFDDSYKPTFEAYADHYAKAYGIIVKKPKNFTDLHQYFIAKKLSSDTANMEGLFMGPMLESADRECIIGFPASPYYISRKEATFDLKKNDDSIKIWSQKNAKIARTAITREIKATLGYPTYTSMPYPKDSIMRTQPNIDDTTQIDFNQYVTIIAGKKAREMFNADSVFVYNLPLENPYDGKYPYCTCIFVSKKDRAKLPFKFFLTGAGKKNEQEYIELLSKAIWYNDGGAERGK